MTGNSTGGHELACPDCGAIGVTKEVACPHCGRQAADTSASTDGRARTNWAGNRRYHAAGLARPTRMEELQELVATTPRIHALGTGHSFNGVADTTGTQVSLDGLPPFVEIDTQARTATVSAWSTYGDVAPAIDAHGFALATLASLPHISVAGACATATHGSGVANRNLSAAVAAMEIVTGTGERCSVSRASHPDTFPGMVVHLGALGIVVAVTLDLVDSLPVHQRAWVDLPRDHLDSHLDEVLAGAESVSCFTRWRHDTIETVLHKSRGDPADDPERIGPAIRATEQRHPISGLSAEHVTEQLGRPGSWYERLPHFRMGFTPSAGEEIQSEWFVDRAVATDAIDALWDVGDLLDDVLQVSEIRTVAADDLWLSPAYDRDLLALHFTWIREPRVVDRAIDAVEDALAPFDPVPHWGKVSHARRELFARRWDRLDDFAALAARFDPDGRFRNAFLDDALG